jgi:hypothetical protein
VNPNVVIEKMYEQGAKLGLKTREFAEIGIKLAGAEKKYNQALSEKMLRFKSDGYAITTCEKLSKGDDLVANLKYEKDVQEILLDACKKAINTIDKQIEILRSDLSYQKQELSNIGQTQQC